VAGGRARFEHVAARDGWSEGQLEAGLALVTASAESEDLQWVKVGEVGGCRCGLRSRIRRTVRTSLQIRTGGDARRSTGRAGPLPRPARGRLRVEATAPSSPPARWFVETVTGCDADRRLPVERREPAPGPVLVCAPPGTRTPNLPVKSAIEGVQRAPRSSRKPALTRVNAQPGSAAFRRRPSSSLELGRR
jgi:hypothetical protein